MKQNQPDAVYKERSVIESNTQFDWTRELLIKIECDNKILLVEEFQ